ncbi:MAG TPA: hypothetical protein VJ596_11550 [Gemmatimonadaceae bacterium]|nr:hypothetical protein [Gemmatimonadaceae bacterium]
MRVGYICDGGGSIGWGHIGRGRALLEAAEAGSALVVGSGRSEVASWLAQRAPGILVAPWDTPEQPCDPPSCPYDALVIDHYSLSQEWICGAIGHRPVLVVDDWLRVNVEATGLINPNLGADRADYPAARVEQWMLGASYALLRREVRASRATLGRDVVPHIVLTFGGSDPAGHTAAAANTLTEASWYRNGGRLTVVLGMSYRGSTPWTAWDGQRSERTEVLHQPADFIDRCWSADIVVCGASTTTYEVASLGRPFLPVALVPNQERVTAAWAEQGIGEALSVRQTNWTHSMRTSVEALLADEHRRHEAVRTGSALVDGRGVERVLAACATALAAR